nr:60S ribosomal protein L23 [Tanacetum cinerariifolium]
VTLDVKGIPKSYICSCCNMVMYTVKKGKPDLKNKVMPDVVVRLRKSLCRKDGVFIYFKGYLISYTSMNGTYVHYRYSTRTLVMA